MRRKPAKPKVAHPNVKSMIRPFGPSSEQTAQRAAAAATSAAGETNSAPTESPLIRLLLVAAAVMVLLSVCLAALPFPAPEWLVRSDTDWRTGYLATFVNDHRVDIVIIVGGIATLLVALVVALPMVAG